jgi:hypothetical protein
LINANAKPPIIVTALALLEPAQLPGGTVFGYKKVVALAAEHGRSIYSLGGRIYKAGSVTIAGLIKSNINFSMSAYPFNYLPQKYLGHQGK